MQIQLTPHPSHNRIMGALPVLLLLSFLPAMSARGQKETKPKEAAAAPTALPTSVKPGEFYEKDIDLHFNYPVEMRVLDPVADMEQGHLAIYGASGDTDPEHLEAKRCIRPILDVDLPEDKAPHRPASLEGIWVDDSKEYKDSRKSAPIFAKIYFIEMLAACVPKDLRKRENDLLGSMAMSFVSAPGMQRMPKPLWFDVAGQKLHMNSATGRVVVNGNVAPAPIFILSMTTQWRGHLLAWVFTSDDTEMLNGITKSVVQFGNGPWGTMFPANIGPQGSGTPMTILPN